MVWKMQSHVHWASLAFVCVLSTIFSVGSASAQTRVINGHPAASGAHPWMVALLDASQQDSSNAQICGGSLIGSRWVLTAAHCITESYSGSVRKAYSIDVLVGQEDLSQSGGDRAQVVGVYRHPAYNQMTFANDFALLKLNRDFSGPYMSLATSSALYPANTLATLVGWGWTNPDYPSRAWHLQEAIIPVPSDAVCLSELGELFTPEVMLCAGVPPAAPGVNDGVSACYGDSGGPLYLTLSDGKPVQIGVVTGGKSCSDPSSRSFFAEVASAQSFLAMRPIFPPEAIERPQVVGPPYVGNVLTCLPGNYSGDGIETISYSWFQESNPNQPIPGADRSTYTPTQDDAGKWIRCDVTTSNAGGSTVAVGEHFIIRWSPNSPEGDLESPIGSLISGRCQSTRCEVRVAAYDNVGVVAVVGTAVRSYSSTCRIGRRRTTCSKADSVSLAAVPQSDGSWLARAPLARGKVQSITFHLRAYDAAGNYQAQASVFRRRVRAR